MTSPSTPLRHDLRGATTRSTASRLLEGAGHAALVAYRHDPDRSHPVLAHGLTADGLLAVALPTDRPELGDAGVDVRLRIDQHGADPRLRVSTASLHALAHVRAVSAAEAADLCSRGSLPRAIAWAADAGAQVALVSLDRVVLPDQGGVSALPFAEVVDGRQSTFPAPQEEWECREIVQRMGDDRTARVAAEVVAGHRRGMVAHGQPTPASVRPFAGQTLLADVDSTGCTWIEVQDQRTRAVFVPFDLPVTTLEELEVAIGGWGQLAA